MQEGPRLLLHMPDATSTDLRPSNEFKQKLSADPNSLGPNVPKLKDSQTLKHMGQSISDLSFESVHPSLGMGTSMKAKKKNAPARALDSSSKNPTGKKQLPLYNTTSRNDNEGSSSFNPKFQFTSAVDSNHNGCGLRDPRGLLSRSSSLSASSVEVLQSENLEGVRILCPPHREEHQSFGRSNLEGNDIPMVAASRSAIADAKRRETMGSFCGEENGGTARMEFEGGQESLTSN